MFLKRDIKNFNTNTAIARLVRNEQIYVPRIYAVNDGPDNVISDSYTPAENQRLSRLDDFVIDDCLSIHRRKSPAENSNATKSVSYYSGDILCKTVVFAKNNESTNYPKFKVINWFDGDKLTAYAMFAQDKSGNAPQTHFGKTEKYQHLIEFIYLGDLKEKYTHWGRICTSANAFSIHSCYSSIHQPVSMSSGVELVSQNEVLFSMQKPYSGINEYRFFDKINSAEYIPYDLDINATQKNRSDDLFTNRSIRNLFMNRAPKSR